MADSENTSDEALSLLRQELHRIKNDLETLFDRMRNCEAEVQSHVAVCGERAVSTERVETTVGEIKDSVAALSGKLDTEIAKQAATRRTREKSSASVMNLVSIVIAAIAALASCYAIMAAN